MRNGTGRLNSHSHLDLLLELSDLSLQLLLLQPIDAETEKISSCVPAGWAQSCQPEGACHSLKFAVEQ